MTLGKRQKETLQLRYIAPYHQSTIKGELSVVVGIGSRRMYTREFGGGMAITCTLFEYGDRQWGDWIGNCSEEYTAVEKAQEIARHLVANGWDKEQVKIRKG